MPALYNTYNEVSASRVIRWRRDSRYAVMAIWDPPVAFTGPRPVYIFEPGGARQARRDLSIGAAENGSIGSGDWTTAGLMTNVFGAYVVCVSTPPGGLDFEGAEEPDQEYAPDCRSSAALAAMFLRGNYDNTAVVGATRTIAPEPRYWCGGGASAGCWNQLGAQMMPHGSFGPLADRLAARGGSFKYDDDHRVGYFVGSIGQNRVSTFCEYYLDPALSGGGGSYVTSSSVSVGGSVIPLSGDTKLIYRANRIYVRTTTSYTVSSTTSAGSSSLPITGSATAIPAGCIGSVSGYTFHITADFAGGTGNLDARLWSSSSGSVSSGASLEIIQEFAVTADFGGGPGSVSVWPNVQFPIQSSSVVEVRGFNWSSYGTHSWAVGYLGTASMGRVWRSDAASGLGVPMAEKVDANVDRVVRADNPRVFELNIMLSGGGSESLQRVDSLTAHNSFWVRRNADPSAVVPEFIDLHDASDMAHLAHQIYLLRSASSRNVSGIEAYLSDRRGNPTATGVVPANQPWLKGRSASFDYTAVQAFLTSASRFGGAFA
jgi:hypothetical protein